METVVVTGATSGIGFVTALELARAGRNVIALGRSAEKIRARDTEIRAAVPDARIDWVKADFASLAEVASASREIGGKVDRIDVLVNNAGNQLDRRMATVDGFEMTYQVNHLAPFLMTAHLLPLLLRTPQPRIITTSSIGHTMIDDMAWDDLQSDTAFSTLGAYCQSKLANVLFTRELARRNGAKPLVASAVHPGLVASDFPNKGEKFMQDYYRAAEERGEAFTSEQGADTVIWLAQDAAAGRPSGGYFYQRERVDVSPAAANPASATRLWEISERQIEKFL
jgi:retinol dehydrogenase-12